MAQGYPNHQPFNIKGRKNLTKKDSWFQHPPYHNNKTNRKTNKD